ncbi:MAG: nucleotidyltransferase [Streptococcus salivarius]
MTVTGIIAEFNPFHNGHKYLLDQAEGVKIVAMSGNFVQRGEPAIVDKWTRAQMALENGADLVVELPFLTSVQSADYFAAGAVDILSRLGIDSLTFGTEGPRLPGDSNVYAEKSEDMEAFVENLPSDLSYPQKTQKMWEKFAGVDFTGNTPNHILGLAYAKACAGKGIKLNPIQRQGAGYHSSDKEVFFASATSLRLHKQDSDFVDKFMPNSKLFQNSPQVSWDNYFQLLVYQILTNPDLTSVFQVNEEIASRLKAAIREASSVEELVDKVATKRYTKARVRRILTYILVGAVDNPLAESIHVLGFSQKGQSHLKSVKKSVDIVARIGREPWDMLTQQADNVYQLGNPELSQQNFGRIPHRVK